MMKSVSKILLITASIVFISIVGAGLYEHVAAVPTWTSAPPKSLSMFQGEYGLKPGNFWRVVHPIAVLLLLAALAANWKEPGKKQLIAALGGYILVIIVTAIYFVPELLSIVTSAYSQHVSDDLKDRAELWETLSLVRLAVMAMLSAVLLYGVGAQTGARS